MRIIAFISLAIFQLSISVDSSAEQSLPLNSSGVALNSYAYQQFRRRPKSDFSKLIYLIDHFKDSKLEVYYDGFYYKARFAGLIARYFLRRNYKNETVETWVLRWCNRSIGGSLIYVKFTDGKFRPSREVLMDEYRTLEQALTSYEVHA